MTTRGRRRQAPRRAIAAAVGLLVLAAALVGCRDSGDEVLALTTPAATDPVRVGAWEGVEGQLLGRLVSGLLEAQGIDTELTLRADPAAARRALELGDVDVLVGYTGAAWLEALQRSDPPGDPRTSFARVREFDERQGITWLRPRFAAEGDPTQPPANATFAFFVAGPPSSTASLTTMSELASRLATDPDALVCVDPEFLERPDGLAEVWRAYGVRADREVFPAAPSDAMLGVAAGDCVAGLATTTDGLAWRYGLRPLVDDLEVFPAFIVSVQIRDDVRQRLPGLVPAVAPLTSQLTTRLLASMNGKVLGVAHELRLAAIDEVARAGVDELLTRAGRPPTSDASVAPPSEVTPGDTPEPAVSTTP